MLCLNSLPYPHLILLNIMSHVAGMHSWKSGMVDCHCLNPYESDFPRQLPHHNFCFLFENSEYSRGILQFEPLLTGCPLTGQVYTEYSRIGSTLGASQCKGLSRQASL